MFIYRISGIYNDKEDVAVKIFMDGMAMNKEMFAYTALNAVMDEKIEDHHIPRIYYNGLFLGKYYAIAMSRFDGTLADYYKKRNDKHLSNANILYVLMQTVCVNLNLNICKNSSDYLPNSDQEFGISQHQGRRAQ